MNNGHAVALPPPSSCFLRPLFFKVLRQRGLAAIERLMGMLLIMVSVQMLLNGIRNVVK